MRLINIANNLTTDFTLLKLANLSNYTERYDKFSIDVGYLETGSYRYEVYDTNSTVGAAVAVVETGLAYDPGSFPDIQHLCKYHYLPTLCGECRQGIRFNL